MSGKKETYSVGELTQYIKFRLEQDPLLRTVEVEGEISNFTRHSSGHLYFTLKDSEAQIGAVMFRGNAMQLAEVPRSGDKVKVVGDISVYPPRGNYQLLVRKMSKSGLGDLHQQFLVLKDRLEKEGLFDPAAKKPIPRFPEKIGVVTSPTGAVIEDITNTLKRRFPHVELILSPAKVQGADAAPTLMRALKRLEKEQPDVVLLARGGGSLEDLWCFNDEALARFLAQYPLPLISGVGHETDFTIADFVSDRRASTPTAAAELAVPDAREIRQSLDGAENSLQRNLRYFIDYRRQMLDELSVRMEQNLKSKLQQARNEIEVLEVKLQSLDIRKTLERGYSLTRSGGKLLKSVEEAEIGATLKTYLADGVIESTVQAKEKKA